MLSLNSPNAIPVGLLPAMRLDRGDERGSKTRAVLGRRCSDGDLAHRGQVGSSTGSVGFTWSRSRATSGPPLARSAAACAPGVVGRQLLGHIGEAGGSGPERVSGFCLAVEQWRGVSASPRVGRRPRRGRR